MTDPQSYTKILKASAHTVLGFHMFFILLRVVATVLPRCMLLSLTHQTAHLENNRSDLKLIRRLQISLGARGRPVYTGWTEEPTSCLSERRQPEQSYFCVAYFFTSELKPPARRKKLCKGVWNSWFKCEWVRCCWLSEVKGCWVSRWLTNQTT